MTTPDPTPKPRPHIPRWHRRKQARPAEIIDAALIEFGMNGFAGTRLEDIARRAGCTKGTIFLYFENKQELFKEMARRTMLPLLESTESLVEQHQGSVEELLVAILRRRWEFMTSGVASALPKLMFSEASHFPELAGFYHDEIITRSHALVDRVLRLGVERGEFVPMDTANTARMAVAPMLLVAMWKHSFVTHTPARDAIHPQTFFDTSLETLLRGIRRSAHPESVSHA